MIKVGIVDDHPVVRVALHHLFRTYEDIHVAGEAKNALEAVDLVCLARPHVLILDLDLPGRSGLDVLPLLRRQVPQMGVVVFTSYPEEQYAIKLLQMGASAFVPKCGELDVLLTAIRTVAGGRRWISPDQAELIAQADVTRCQEPRDILTARELQVLLKVARGMTSAEIANALSLSMKSITSYRARLRTKLSVSTTSELTYYALKHQLLD